MRALVFARELDPARLEVDEEKQRVYRGLVRNGVSSVIKKAVPVLRAVWGEDEVEELITRFLDEAGPKTRFYRAIPMDFSAWVQTLDDLPHPAISELVHFEVTQLEVMQAPNPEPALRREKPDDELAVEFCPSARMLMFTHPVHKLSKDAEGLPGKSRQATVILAHRVAEKMRWVKLPVTVAQLLAVAVEQPLGPAMAALQASGVEVDEGFVRSWLVNLRCRGAILGFYLPED
jgi:hypothetical protein